MAQMKTMEVNLTAGNAPQDITVKNLDLTRPRDSAMLVTTAQEEQSHPPPGTTW